MASSREILVSVESLLEQEIDEISRTGEETYIKPLTLAEELKTLAQKIDFSDASVQDYPATPEKENEQEDKTTQGKPTSAAWPWENVQRNLRTALSEIGILLDVLQVVNSKKYVVLDPVSQPQEPPKPTVQMLSKKKALSKASEVIRKGAERMILQQAQPVRDVGLQQETPRSSYYKELMKLRRSWKLKRSANNVITGDLSYRNDGSSFWHQGLFEVRRQENQEADVETEGCPLTVKVPPDLNGFAELSVSFGDTSSSPATTSGLHVMPNSRSETDIGSSWHQNLKQAQSNLFCKELFTQLSREAFHESSSGFYRVTENEVTMELFQGKMLTVKYNPISNATGCDKKDGDENDNADDEDTSSLACRLQQLLHEQHKRHFQMRPPHPATCDWAPKHVPQSNFHFMLHPHREEKRTSLCENFLAECRHHFVKQRTNALLDELAHAIKDPQIMFHWNPLASTLDSSVTVHIVSRQYAIEHRTSVHIGVKARTYHVVCMDGTMRDFDYEENALGQFLANQVTLHLRDLAAKLIGVDTWRIMHTQDNVTAIRGAVIASLTASSKNNDKAIMLDIASAQNVSVKVSTSSLGMDKDNLNSLLDDDWAALAKTWHRVSWTELDGDTFIAKLRALLAIVSCS